MVTAPAADLREDQARVDVPAYQATDRDHMFLDNWERSSVMNDLDRDFMYYNPRGENTGDLLREQHRIAATLFPQSMQYPRQYLAKTEAAHRVLKEALSGSRMGKAEFLEAISYDDFSYIMQDTIYRKLLGKWAVPRSPMGAFSKEVKVPTMQRPGKMFTLDGLETPLPLVHPGQQPDLRYPYDSGIAIRPYKYMADVEILWETLLEDDLNALGDIPDRLNNAVQVTMGRINTQLYADSAGWRDGAAGDPFFVTNNDKILNPSLATATAEGIANGLLANANHSTRVNAKLSLPAIQAARSQISKFLSPDGNPIDVSLVHLVVGNGQEQVAKNILGAQQYVMERSGGLQAGTGANEGFVRMQVGPDVISGIKLHVDPYMHIVVDGAIEDTMWMMLADPGLARPMFAHCYLAGYEAPFLARRIPAVPEHRVWRWRRK